MKAIKVLAALLLVAMSQMACKKEITSMVIAGYTIEGIPQTNEILIFGRFYGMCAGETCVETFALADGKLYEDSNDYYAQPQELNFTELSAAQYNQVANLLDSIPAGLYTSAQTLFGCPDCADQGGLFILIKDANMEQNFRVDQSKTNVPAYLHNFMDMINAHIESLQ
jgi:hypothetical protein